MRVARKASRIMAGALVAIGILLLLCLARLGAFGGAVYTDLPSASRAGTEAHGQGRGTANVAAVLLSGDLGFHIGMGPAVARRLARGGIPVTGVNSLVYFRTRRSPDEIAAFLAATMRHAQARTGATRLVLIGQSYGADMLHVGLSRLPPVLRRRIALVALVVPTDPVYYSVSLVEPYAWRRPDARAIDTARRLDWVPLLCIRGVEETDSLCPLLHGANVEHVALPGGHALHRDANAVAALLLRRIAAVAGR